MHGREGREDGDDPEEDARAERQRREEVCAPRSPPEHRRPDDGLRHEDEPKQERERRSQPVRELRPWIMPVGFEILDEPRRDRDRIDEPDGDDRRGGWKRKSRTLPIRVEKDDAIRLGATAQTTPAITVRGPRSWTVSARGCGRVARRRRSARSGIPVAISELTRTSSRESLAGSRGVAQEGPVRGRGTRASTALRNASHPSSSRGSRCGIIEGCAGG